MLDILNIKKIDIVTAILLIAIMYIAFFVRSATLSAPTVLDHDPWYFYRHAESIVKNGMTIPKWDYLSFYPPGRPVEPFEGWPYTIALLYKFFSLFGNFTLMDIAKWSPIIMVILSVIPAYLLGKTLVNRWAGISTAFFATLAPALISVSIGGYSDNDAPEVFYFFLSVYAIILGIKKKKPIYYAFAVLSNLLFVFNWGGGWLPTILFLVFIPAYLIFRVIEEIIHNRKISFNRGPILTDFKEIIKPLLIIVILTSAVGFGLGFGSPIHSLIGGLGFTGLAGESLIVNISVAELQPLNVFTQEGFATIVNRVGLIPVVFTLFLLPILVIYKLIKKKRIDFADVFLFLWALVGYYLITRGVRFSLLFAIASTATAGYVIGNISTYNKKNIITAFIFGIILFLSLSTISNAISLGLSSSGVEISQGWYDILNWLKQNADKDSLISTWWDPGHIITGYTGLKVHADGAHCTADHCVPYNHNIRIRDMGRILSTSDENEAASLLLKYKELSPQQCQRVKSTFGNIVPEDACKPVSDIYVIASNDLIGKYYWLSFFGTYDASTKSGQGKNFAIMSLSGQTESELTYVGGGLTASIVQKDGNLIPILTYQGQNAVIKHLAFFNNNQLQILTSNNTQHFDGMLFVDQGFKSAVLMDAAIRDSMFTRMYFFNGEGLTRFEIVYQNPEIKVFKLKA